MPPVNIDINIREARPEDAPQIAEVHIKSWRQAYKGIIHQSYLDNGLDVGDRTKRWQEDLKKSQKRTFLAFNGVVLTGFATVGRSQDEQYSDYVELYAIYLDPCYFSKCIGKALFQYVEGYAITQGFEKMFTNVLVDNKVGRSFYERMGAVPIKNSEKKLTIDDKFYMEMKYEWRELRL